MTNRSKSSVASVSAPSRRPDVCLQRYNNTGEWTVFVYGKGNVATCPTAGAAIAAMRLVGGREALKADVEYLLGLGCVRGDHMVLDALAEALR
jgi:hypothetical protein